MKRGSGSRGGSLVVLSCAFLLACGSTKEESVAGATGGGGSAPVAGTGSGGVGGVASSATGGASPSPGGTGGATGVGPSTCPADRPALADENTARVTFATEVRGGGKKVVIGEARAWGSEQVETVTTFVWFFAAPRAKNESGAWVEGQLLGQDGQPAPYGVALLNLMSSDTLAVRVALPPGSYSALELGVGVPADCNDGDPTNRMAPLDVDSGMFWTWGTQYMFAQLSGNSRVEQAGAPTNWFWHAGLNVAYSTATLEGAFSAGQASTGPRVLLDLDWAVASLMPNSHGSETSSGGAAGSASAGGSAGSPGAGGVGGSGGAGGSAGGLAPVEPGGSFEESFGEAWLIRGMAKRFRFE